MNTLRKLEILADAAKYDASCASSGSRRAGNAGQLGHTDGTGICHSYTPDGRCVSLLKVLLTNYCIYDCRFCVNRLSNDVQRARFSVEEVVRLTIEFYRRNYIEGLFLSSGIIQSADYTMEQVLEVAKRLRLREGFGGYIHLKVAPGAAETLVEEAGLYADRLSANVELPTERDLQELAPEKKLGTIERSMGQIRVRREQAFEERKKSKRAPSFAPAGQSTQMVVGANATPDVEILSSASRLYRRHKLRRIYYSAYSPIPGLDADLPAAPPPLEREHRLYQADWLMRFYGFEAEELVGEESNLPLEMDPKLAWALRHPQHFPIDVNRATRRWLLRVPGIGQRGVARILKIRRHQPLTLGDLGKLRVAVRRAQHFVVTSDHRPRGAIDLVTWRQRVRVAGARLPARQLGLPFGSAVSAVSGTARGE